MKTFEEKFVAWQDGTLENSERESFENELAVRLDSGTDPAKDLLGWQRVRDMLRADADASLNPSATLSNPDFFSHQIRAQIDREPSASAGRSVSSQQRAPVSFWFGLPKFAWAGVVLLAAGFVLSGLLIPRGQKAATAQMENAEPALIVETRTFGDGIVATEFKMESAPITVLWLDGLEYLPPDRQLN